MRLSVLNVKVLIFNQGIGKSRAQSGLNKWQCCTRKCETPRAPALHEILASIAAATVWKLPPGALKIELEPLLCGKKWPILPLTWLCGARAQNLSYKREKKQEMPDWEAWSGVKRNFRGRSCPGSLSQVEALPGTSCRWCRSGGCRRTAEPARRLGCCPTASQSTSTHCLLLRHTGRCNRCWSGERTESCGFTSFIRSL